MDVFKASFRFYEAGAPYPGICLKCGAGSNLWDLGRNISGTNMGAYYCDECLVELATYTGMKSKTLHESTVDLLSAELATAKAQLEAAPKIIKELTNGINSLLSDFVTELAGVSGVSKPVQPKGAEANSGDSGEIIEEPGASVKGSAKATKPSTKSSK
jgi:hypothetical protein